MNSRTFDRLALIAAVVIFCAAIIVLFREFASVSPRDVIARLAALPKRQFFSAIGITATSYLFLTGYDFLALRYIQYRLRFCDVLFASFTAFALSNNVGFQLLSGGSMRYRIYSRFGLDAIQIGEIVAFCTIAYALGIITVGGLLAVLDPIDIASLLHLPSVVIVAGGVSLLCCSIGYLLAAGTWRKHITLGGHQLRPPSLILAASQVGLASFDAILASTVLYVLLPADFDIGFQSFLCIYLIAATASVLSLVPGGLGVFETAITVMATPSSKAAMLGMFFAYRMIYFILPLVVAIICLTVHEVRRHSKRLFIN